MRQEVNTALQQHNTVAEIVFAFFTRFVTNGSRTIHNYHLEYMEKSQITCWLIGNWQKAASCSIAQL